MTEPSLFRGSRVSVSQSTAENYDVILDRRFLLATCADPSMANVIARAANAYVPEGSGTETAARYISYAFAAMPGARFLVASVMEAVSRQMRSDALKEPDPAEELALNRSAAILSGIAQGMKSNREE